MLLLPVAWACRVSPLTNRIAVGEEAYLVFVGEGRDGWTDLFAGAAGGGPAVRFTFSREAELSPALDPTGAMVAFLRGGAEGDPVFLTVMNLLSATERETRVPAALGRPERVAWSADGTRLYVRAAAGMAGIWWTPAPPEAMDLAPVAEGPAWAAADSALAVEVGRPAFGRVVDCEGGDPAPETGRALCVDVPDRLQQLLVFGATDPFRWGSDSVAYLVRGQVEVRPLGGGRGRQPEWVGAPANLRQPTYFGGVPGPG